MLMAEISHIAVGVFTICNALRAHFAVLLKRSVLITTLVAPILAITKTVAVCQPVVVLPVLKPARNSHTVAPALMLTSPITGFQDALQIHVIQTHVPQASSASKIAKEGPNV